MRIFSRRKERETSELLILPMQEEQHYDFFAALAKALLLFLLVYGALGGFLSAFEIEYNKGLCMLVLFLLALILSAIYETGRRLFTNLLTMVVFGVYVYVAFSNYWAINSGYYAIMNNIFKQAREYLDISSGIEYSTVVQDEYATVTLLVIFIGMVGAILLNIQIQNKCSLFKIMLLTFSPYVVPFYLECSPSLIYMMFLFAGYVTAAILENGNVRERLSGQMRYVLPAAALAVVLIIRLTTFVLPEATYNRLTGESDVKESTREGVAKFAQFGMSALLRGGSSGAGMSGGMLSKGSAVMPNYETDFIVRFTPYSFNAVYLKAFTGKDYTGERWTPAEEEGLEDGKMLASVEGRKQAYEKDSSQQGKAVMELVNVGADSSYEYHPYYTDYDKTGKLANVSTYTYYPAGGSFTVQGQADEAYLRVPDSCIVAVRKICEEAGFAGTPQEIAGQIVTYFNENYSYTMRPGYYWGDSDYISHFLTESKRGYCAHFASSGTMLFRYMGIPARYVEGYAFSYLNVIEDGVLVGDADYSDYYDGYSALGETALVELEIPDACAHAWVEIYVEGAGWIVIDPTPASSEEETTSFWDAFMNMGGEGDVPAIGENDLGRYLERALSGVSFLFPGICIPALIVYAIVRMVRARRERAMPGKERVRLEYTRLLRCLKRKNKEHAKLKTLAEQLDCMRRMYDLEVSAEQEQTLYQAFFAPEFDCDCEAFCRELIKLRRKLCNKWH